MAIDVREFRRSLRRIERRVMSQLKAQTACCGVTAAQCHVMLELEDVGETTLNGLAERLRLDASTMSRTVEGLVRAGLVDRAADPRDRRAVMLRLTHAGARKSESINQSCDDFYRAVLQGIPEERHAALTEAITKVAEILSGIQEPWSAETPCACKGGRLC